MAQSLLCETVAGRTMADLIAQRDAVASADMVELRLDGVADLDIARALHGRARPAIVTCRPRWEGGRFEGSEEERQAVLVSALQLGAEFVDIEWKASFDEVVGTHASRVVLSSHDFEGVPVDLRDRVRTMRRSGAAVIKIAVTAKRLSETLPLFDIAREDRSVVIAMGEAGVPSRLLASRFGSEWTYAGAGVAPGQMPAERMVREFRFRDIGPATTLYGVVGNNVTHSISPAMHNAAFAAAGINAVYVPLRAADFDDFLAFADVLGLDGASVTVPYKLDALRAAESADARTHQIGAANTLRRRNGAWEATNTDVEGLLAPLDAAYPGSLRGARTAVLGAGGAARAAVVALNARGAEVTVYARRHEQALEVAQSLGARAAPWPPPAGSWDVLINCTPLGGASARDQSPLPDGPFLGRLVYDLSYGAEEPRLLWQARQAGCLSLDGLPMLIAQAERQFEWWTDLAPPAGVMRAAAERQAGIDNSRLETSFTAS